MPKLGAEPIRKAALINATIATIGRRGSLDVTVAQIAREAGMSTALAHHYFGSKERIFLSAMRHILTQYRRMNLAALRGAKGPRARLYAIVGANFGGDNFERETIAAWLSFYSLAFVDAEAARLLRVYHRRLHSNLMSVLRPLVGDQAANIAHTLGALIDGVYLRAALSDAPEAQAAERLTLDYLERVLP
ncbi:choline-binding transcriptional repressor BetI [Paracoccus shanxieyensis]|uniref:HTH-type transcriptional regulator BetI n=1 Tax=Paracoccus shanxieyensis TaxID=2675752 RepID=A0A6L6IY36_9RHOB|nr:transcriptional regulator BetI [Paracoccus shanxieyensis]MTH64521.1 transcriptional regulator BetI [Paracoccus shanxieyensis]MTH87486.1 transcriptional regulator BetI [Paracoccus shanxieyensis]